MSQIEAQESVERESRWKQYSAYKDSGIEWLGEIPEHWEVKKLKHISSIQFSNVDKITVDGEKPVRLCNYSDVYNNDFITADLNYMEATATPNEIAKFSIREGDVIITKDSESWDDIAVPAYVTSNIQGVVCGYHLAQVRAYTKWIDGKYLFRSFASFGINDQFQIAATGVTRYGLGKYWLDNSMFLVPPIEEQLAITTFLDCETSRIDTLIARKQRQIELLQEKWAALISHAVTKGLNPDVKMKDSGIEWLGEIPEHWEIIKFAYISNVVRGASPRPAGDPRYFDGDYISWITVGEVTKDEKVYLSATDTMLTEEGAKNSRTINSGTLILTNSGATLGVPKILLITGCANDGIVAFERLSKKANKFFLYFYLSSLTENLRDRIKQGGGQPNLNTDIIKALNVPFPPINEQHAIATFLDKESQRIEVMISKVKESIDKLQEYRIALISAAVTGKIDVRKEVS